MHICISLSWHSSTGQIVICIWPDALLKMSSMYFCSFLYLCICICIRVLWHSSAGQRVIYDLMPWWEPGKTKLAGGKKWIDSQQFSRWERTSLQPIRNKSLTHKHKYKSIQYLVNFYNYFLFEPWYQVFLQIHLPTLRHPERFTFTRPIQYLDWGQYIQNKLHKYKPGCTSQIQIKV